MRWPLSSRNTSDVVAHSEIKRHEEDGIDGVRSPLGAARIIGLREVLESDFHP